MSLKQLWDDMYFGNGRPGMTTRMALMEDAVTRINGKLSWMIGTAITAAIALAGDIIVHLVK